MRQQASEWIEGYRSGDRAVSPVIGVILMVAITVILAAVIAAFVLGGVGTGEKVPSAQMTMSQSDGITQSTLSYTSGNYNKCGSMESDEHTIEHQISASHDGGDAIIERNLQVYVSTGNGTPGSSADDAQAARGIGVTSVSTSCSDPDTQQKLRPLWNARTDEKVQANAEIKVRHWMREDTDITASGFSPNADTATLGYKHSKDSAGNWWFGVNVGWWEDQGAFTNSNEIIFGQRTCIAFWEDTGASSNRGDLGIFTWNVGAGGPGNTHPENCGENSDWSQSPSRAEESLDMIDSAQGPLYTGDEVRVVWSPPDSDKSQELASKEVQ